MTIQERFEQFHAKNPLVYQYFKRFAFQVIGKGYQRFSADWIMHHIRWENLVNRGNKKFKVNNDYVALYARMFMFDFPQFKGIFETRQRKTA